MHSSFLAIGQVINVDITLPHLVLLTSWKQDYRKNDFTIQGISKIFSYRTLPQDLSQLLNMIPCIKALSTVRIVTCHFNLFSCIIDHTTASETQYHKNIHPLLSKPVPKEMRTIPFKYPPFCIQVCYIEHNECMYVLYFLLEIVHHHSNLWKTFF